MSRFENQVMVVTGAASGIGRSIALRANEEGAHVVAVDLNAQRLAELQDAVTVKEKLTPVAADLLKQEGIDAVIAAVPDKIDVLINNAGIMDGFTPVSDLADDMWDAVIGVNLTAPMKLMRAFVPRMVEAQSGAIVNISSLAGTTGGAAGAAYTASKHGVIGLTRNTAALYAADGIRVNAVCPGGVATNIAEGGAVPAVAWAWERIEKFMGRPTRMADPQDVASNALYLASAEAVNLNGVILASDGGWTAA